jgi:5-methylcytosine-specific restriction protein A
MLTLERGRKYSRPDLKALAGLRRDAKGGNWDTGVVEHDGQFIIFANVGTEGRTGHNYGNRWEGTCLRWYHKSGSHLAWDSVQRLLERGRVVHIFWRSSNEDPFEYVGEAKPVEVADTAPVEILWSFDAAGSDGQEPVVHSPEQVTGAEYREGAVRQVLVNAYERDQAARQACIAHFGLACAVCGLRFEEVYGPLGTGFIHVHHIVPLSELGTEYSLNPVTDLRPVCPNCHAMVHRQRPPLSLDELRAFLRAGR